MSDNEWELISELTHWVDDAQYEYRRLEQRCRKVKPMPELEDFKPQQRVIYIPRHANGDRTHKDCERGRVSSVNSHYVFVRFNRHVAEFGWDGATSMACRREDLIVED